MRPNWKDITFVGILFIFIIAQIIGYNNELSDDGDNARYMILAKSLSEFKGYREINDPSWPEHNAFPPMFPILLVPIVWLFGLNITAFKLFVILLSIITLYVVYLYMNTITKPEISLAITAMTAFSFQYFHWSHRVMSEVPFILFSLLALYFLKKEKGYYAAFFTLITIFTKSIGIMLLPAVVLTLLFKKQYKYAIILFLLVAAPFTLWSIRNQKYSSQTYFDSIKYIDPDNHEYGVVTVRDMADRISANIINYLDNLSQFMFHYRDTIQKKFFFSNLLFLIPIFFGAITLFLKKDYVIPLYVLFSFGLLIIWPWQTIRFIVPFLPLIYYFFIIGVLELLSFLKDNVTFNIDIVFYIVLILLVVIQLPSFVEKIKMDKEVVYSTPVARFKAMAEWASVNVGDDEVTMARKPYLFYIWSGGKLSKKYPYTTNENVWLQEAFSSDYLLYDEISQTTHLYLNPIITQFNQVFVPVYNIEQTAMLKIRTADPIFEVVTNE